MGKAKASKEIIQKHEQMFYPTVRVRTKKAGGSGTVVYSKKHKDEVYTYVITNHHVIQDSVHLEKKWDSVLKRKVDKEKQVFKRPKPLKTRLTVKEQEAHIAFVKKLGKNALWNKLVTKN